jgi:glycosyltransferase involved in cell wall biosynthesis
MKPIRVVALVEATFVTGPAGNLIRFCKLAHSESCARVSIAAFHRRTPDQPADRSNAFFDAVRSAGIELDIIPERQRFDRTVIPLIRDIAVKRGADIIQTHAVKSHFLVRYAGLHRDFRWLAFQHGYTAEDLKMRLYIQLDRWSLQAACQVATVCVPFANALVKTGVKQERIHVLPNSIGPVSLPDAGEVQDLKQRLGIPDSAKVILSIGRLSTEKAHSDLIAALRLLKRDRPELDVRLVIVGDGLERLRLESMAASYGLTDCVVFAGQQRNVWPYYGFADLFVLPSLSEGSPNVLLEAMAASVPIVATAVGGVPETVENESSALLVPARTPTALSAAMERVLGDPDLAARLSAQALTRVGAHFSPQSYYMRLIALYQTMMGRATAVNG